MARVKRGVAAHKRHKRVFKATKGMQGQRRHSIKKAREALFKAWTYAYRDRRTKKRDFRRLWIQRINAGAGQHGLSYSQFIHGLNARGIQLDRKVLAEMAYNEPAAFEKLCREATQGLKQKPAKAEAAEPVKKTPAKKPAATAKKSS